MFVFGLIAALQVFVKNRTGFLVSRSFLGLAEAGYIPGAVYTLSTWYTKPQLSKRVAILFFGMFGGNAISPLLASGILKLDGQRGLSGWQWLFLRWYRPSLLAIVTLICDDSGGNLHHDRRHSLALPSSRQPRRTEPAIKPRSRPFLAG